MKLYYSFIVYTNELGYSSISRIKVCIQLSLNGVNILQRFHNRQFLFIINSTQ